MRKNISVIVFWGAAWGLIEATLGYILHTLSLSIGWFFWFPLAFYFMDRVYRRTKRPASVLCVSTIAAAIKLIDFLLPTRIDRIVNPAVSILLEGLVVFAVFKLVEHKQDFFRLRHVEAIAASIGWRVLYLIYILLMPPFFYSVSPFHMTNTFLKFMLFESVINSLIIYGYIKLAERADKRKEEVERIKMNRFQHMIEFARTNVAFRTSFSFFILVLAVYLQWVL